jgi:hypothetical protein
MSQSQIEITKVSDPEPKKPPRWYAGMVGQRLPVVSQDDKGFWVRDTAGLLNFIPAADARII